MDLTDEEFSILHNVVYDELFYPNVGKFREEQMELLSSVYGKVMNEAKRRGLWWAQ